MRVWLILFLCTNFCNAEEVRVAVASNFVGVAKVLGERFERGSEHSVVLAPGSTGKQYAQIVNGAPYDVWLAADAARPEALEVAGKIVPGSRVTYAVGRLVLVGAASSDRLVEGRFRKLAIANADLAPFGMAAREVMQKLVVWKRDVAAGKVVRGESVAQAWNFFATKNVDLAFVSASQVGDAEAWVVPDGDYAPIRQQAVLLRDSEGGRAFLEFMRGDEALKLIAEYGYGIPECLVKPMSPPSGSR